VTALGARLRLLWSWRRWAYGLWVLVAIARIPAHTGFHLVNANCDTRLTIENVGLSLTKVPHVVLFGAFFLVTAVQFDRIDRLTLGLSLVATAALGLLVEFEEGAARTGNCRLTDVLPDIVGALLAMVLVMIARIVCHYIVARPHNER
jgi:hypothetical protein